MTILDEKLKKKIGYGTAPLGNLFRDVPEQEAEDTVRAVWDAGIRYFDTAPFYGAGLAEERLGRVLSEKNRDDFILSTKVGRVVLDEKEDKEGLFEDGYQNKLLNEYTEDAVKRSIEQSLERLQTDRLDIVYVHDLSPDFLGDEWITKFDEARNGAFKALAEMRDEGVISAWGLGVNTTIPIELALELEETKPDISLQALQYTLLQHERALTHLMPRISQQNSRIVVGGPYNSGALLGGDHFDYAPITDDQRKHIKQVEKIAERHGVSLKAAALQFSTANPNVSAVIPGSTRPDRIQADLDALSEHIPSAFWIDMIDEGLVSPDAPLPS
ncbi:aldo/keto reductase [Bacillus daqingensis]|uniref:Aldo/keto reductase n=1 Tax=Bacillus daqingensis TaxID=872396 RepID=A0ABV9P0G7_9BACI